jgi:hypothetical protein
MSEYDAALAAAAQKYGVPLPLLKGIAQQESGITNIGATRIKPAVRTDGLPTGLMQLAPDTARSLGVDPNDPAAAIDGGARYLKEGYDQYGNWDDATRFYHGGPDAKLWGPRTQQYHDLVAAHTQRFMSDAGSDGSPSKPSDAFGAAFGDGGSLAAATSPAQPKPSPVSNGSANNDAFAASFGSPAPSQTQIDESGNTGPSQGENQITKPIDWGAGAVSAGSRIAESLLRGGSYLINRQQDLEQQEGPNAVTKFIDPYLTHAAIKLDDLANNIEQGSSDFADEHGADKNSWGYLGGELAGGIVGTLPVSEIKLLEAVPGASKLAAGIARYGNMAIQGGTAGALLSGGRDVGSNALAGVVSAPVLGRVLESVAPSVIKAWEASGGSSLAKTLASRISSGGEPSAAATDAAASDLPPLASGAKIRTGAQMDAAPASGPVFSSASDLAQFRKDFYPDKAALSDSDFLDWFGKSRAVPQGAATIRDQTPPATVIPPTTNIPPEALGSRGGRGGIEAHDQMPPEVAKVYQPLVAKGVAPDEALREADVTANGGNPTAAMVTRNSALMRAEKEGAKLSTPEGQTLEQAQSDNNAALHRTAQGIVSDYGGAPAPGEAMQTAAQSLKKANDAAYQKVSDAYDAARAADGDHTVPGTAVNSIVNSVEAKAQVAGGGPEGQLVNTVKKLTDLYTDEGKQGLYPDQLNSIVRIANGKYDPMGGGVNHWVGEIKKAADSDLAEFDSAGPAYKNARAQMKDYARQYRDPEGVASLIKSDANGNLVRDDSWRSVENMVGSSNDRPFVQIVNQLKANGDTASLSRLKAAVVQDAYERATGRSAGSAADSAGNSPFAGAQFHARLNQIGQSKLKALFSPVEIARLASLGRAGVAVNETVPGTLNSSGTASAVINALHRSPTKLAKAASTGIDAAGAIVGGMMHGGEGAGAGMLVARGARNAIDSVAKQRIAAKLAQALDDMSSPAATRAADAKLANAEAAKATRTAIAKTIANKGAGPAGGSIGREVKRSATGQ